MTRGGARATVWTSRFFPLAGGVLCFACGARSGLNEPQKDTSSVAGIAGAPSTSSGGSGMPNEVGGALGSAGHGGALLVLAGPDPRRSPPVFCSIDEWCGSNANFVAIWGSSPSDIWIVADHAGYIAGTQSVPSGSFEEKSALLHWDGSSWRARQFDQGTRALRSVWGSSKDDVWAVGDGGLLLHFDGSDWSGVSAKVLAPPNFTSVSGSSESDVWAVGAGKTIMHFDGSAWSLVELPVSDKFHAVWSSAAEVWVLGENTIQHFDRSSWSTVARPSVSLLSGVWGRPHHEAWVVGQAGTLASWNLAEWQTQNVQGQSSASNFRALWGNSDNDLWAMGEQGTLAHFDGTNWSAGPELTEAHLNAAWGSGQSTWFVGDNGTFLQFDGQSWAESPLGGHKLKSLWGASPRDVWAVGREMAHWDGDSWQDVPRPGADEALACWGSSATDVWAVGAHGLFLHWDGSTWDFAASPTSADVKGVWGSASQDVWAVDTDGHFLHFDGVAWRKWSAQNFGPLASVWGNTASDVVAVGGKQRIHFDGANWSLLPPHAKDAPHYRVAFGNGRKVWVAGQVPWSAYKAGGAYPELGRWDGLTVVDDLEPRSAPPPIVLNYRSIAAGWAHDERDVWIALPEAIHWDGTQWSYSIVGGTSTLAALWGTETDLWALTPAGQILRKSRL